MSVSPGSRMERRRWRGFALDDFVIGQAFRQDGRVPSSVHARMRLTAKRASHGPVRRISPEVGCGRRGTGFAFLKLDVITSQSGFLRHAIPTQVCYHSSVALSLVSHGSASDKPGARGPDWAKSSAGASCAQSSAYRACEPESCSAEGTYRQLPFRHYISTDSAPAFSIEPDHARQRWRSRRSGWRQGESAHQRRASGHH
jgi:hypothetical protein